MKRKCQQFRLHQDGGGCKKGSLSCNQLLCLALLSPLIVVATPENDPEFEERKRQYKNTIVVSSTRTDRNIDDVPNEVTLINKEDLDQKNPTSLKEVFNQELDLTVRESGKRYGMSGQATGRAGGEGINIRGLEGNQVLIVQDGIRVPNSFQYGPFTTGRADYLNLSHIKKIEVLRGPASTLYGSDGLAGVMSIQTLDPVDLLTDQKNQAAYLQTSYSSQSSAMKADLGAAIREGDWEALVLVNQSYGHEIKNQGENDSVGSLRTKPNPMDQRSQGLIAKIKWNVNERHQVGLGYELKKQNQQSNVLSALGQSTLGPRGRSIQMNTTGFKTEDAIDRGMLSFSHHYKNSDHEWLKRGITQVYIQNASTEQFSKENRTINGIAQERIRLNQYRQDIVGMNTQFESHWHGLADHRIIYGLDLSESKISAVRDGSIPNPSEVFPNRPFPTTRYQMLGGFIQDEVDLGTFTLIPGIRFDQYRLMPEMGLSETAKSATGHAFTPRIGMVWRAHSLFSPYVQYATGYRAPTPDQVNNSFDNRQHGYISIGNENLRPEKAKSLELGVRGRYEKFQYSGAMYVNRYEDFISQEKVSGLGTPLSPSVYQYVNLTHARIRGWDLRADWAMTSRWRVLAGIASATGNSEKNGVVSPLNSVEPMKLIAGVQYANQGWGAQISWRHHYQKKASQVSEIRLSPTQMTDQYIPPAFGVMDLALQYRPLKNLIVRANINNVFDTKYWNWSDVRGVPAQSPVLDAYTAPGRSFNLSLRIDY